jgi:NAD(P)-dependent dehydrogenase (short-subunit alcohol dehydrogenase family)
MGKLTGQVALITGGASGIGLASAQLLAAEECRVFIGDIQGPVSAVDAEWLKLDVADEANWIAAIDTIHARARRLDVLVNNAGIGIGGAITDLSLADWRRQQAINLDGTFLGIKHSLPLMRTGGGGSIINMSSVTALVGSGTFVSYAAAKGGVRSLTKSVAKQCAALKDGVRVNSIHPGIIDTPIFKTLEGVSGSSSDASAMAGTMVPLGHVGEPRDIAAAVLYLASEDSRYVTGSEMVVDGGLIIH